MSNISERYGHLSPLKQALIALEEMEVRLEAVQREPLAIIGMGCRFPGGADSPQAYWQLLRKGVDAIREVPADRWDIDAYFDSDPDAPGKMSTRWGGFLDKIYFFDATFFGISPREAMYIDPQQRLLLEVTWEALEDAGQAPDRLSGSRTGVFVGICRTDYAQLMALSGDPRRFGLYLASGQAHSIAAGRLSYVLGLQGPCMAMDTACSSSLVALHLAAHGLRSGECDLAIVGGTNALLVPEFTIAFSKAHMMAADGRCKTFDARADGYVGGDGCGVVVLKRLGDAIQAGDRILAVIRGTAINQDGASSGLTAPNGPAQQAVIRAALANARVEPARVSYVEAHGTGTPLGDPIEVQALAAVLGAGRRPDKPLAIGSVKTNFGHLEGAAGVAGLIKLVLALQHGEIPPHLHFKEPNPYIPWDELPVSVPTSVTPWPREEGPRIAGLSSFGFSGTNAHVIVEEAPAPLPSVPGERERTLHLLALSARTPSALRELAGRYARHLADRPEVDWADVCYSAATGRAQLSHRLALRATSAEQARGILGCLALGEHMDGVANGSVVGSTRPKVAFLFTGQGAQYPGMGRELYATQPTFRRALERCAEILQGQLEQPLLAVMFGEAEAGARLDQTAYTQPALFALEYALAELWRSWGVEPAWVLGHSLGEFVAACVADILTLEDGLTLIAERARLMQALPRVGAMVAVRAGEERIREALGSAAQEVAIAAVNGPASAVISGRQEAVERAVQTLQAGGVKTKALPVSHAFHSPLMEPMREAFERVAAGVKYRTPRLGLVSNVTGRLLQAGEVDAAYWGRHLRETVQFRAGMETLRAQGATLFLELGPAPVLLGLGRECLGEGEEIWLPSLRRGRADWEQLLESLGALYVRGVEIDWAGYDRDYPRRKVVLPTSPFERREYRIAAIPPSPGASAPGVEEHPLLGRRFHSPLIRETVFEGRLGPQVLPFLRDHQVHGNVVAPAAAYLEMAASAAAELIGPSALEDVVIQEALIVPPDGARQVQLVLSPEEGEGISFRVIGLTGEQASGREFRVHVSGSARRTKDGSIPPEPVSLEAIRARCGEPVDVALYYRWVGECGLELGPGFQGIEQLWRRDGESFARIRIPEGLEADRDAYGIHPSLLDAGFSIVGAALPRAPEKPAEAYMPIGFDGFRLHRQAGARLFTHCVLRAGDEMGRETLAADIQLVDEEGQVVAEARGMRLKRVDPEALGRATKEASADWLYRVEWRATPRPAASQDEQTRVAHTLNPTEIAEHVESRAGALAAEHGLAVYDEFLPRLDVLCAAYVAAAFRRLGWTPQPGELVTTDALATRLGITAQHRRLLGRLLEFFVEDGVLRAADGQWEVVADPPATDPRKLWGELVPSFPAGAAELELVGRCGEELAAVLHGEADPLALLFPGGSLKLAERLYQEAPPSRVFQSLVGDAVAAAVNAVPAGRTVRLLEIGAGTGGTTAYVAPRLPSDRSEYVFTDISPLFVSRAREKFVRYPFMRYEVLDIEQDPTPQNFPTHRYDIILAANVLHATRDLRETLRHVSQLLAPGGLLVLVEVATRQRWIDLTFGLLDGWWRFADTDLRPSYPLLSHPQWIALLEEMGFDSGVKLPRSAEGRILSEHGIVLARGPQDLAEWLILADRAGLGARLAENLEARGERVVTLAAPPPGTGSEPLAALLRQGVGDRRRLRGVLHLWSLDAQAGEGASTAELEDAERGIIGSALGLVKALGQARLQAPPRIWLVTRGAQAVTGAEPPLAVEQSTLWGFAHVVDLEHPELRCTRVDLDPALPACQAAEPLLRELIGPDGEDQLAFRGEVRYGARLVRAAVTAPAARGPQRLQSTRPGVLDGLTLRPMTRRAPGPGEVELRVQAAGLSFRDVLGALGMYPGDPGPLGVECAGQVEAVGEGVEGLRAGDEVLALALGSFASFVTTPADFVVKRPAGMSPEEGATIPGVFLTAWYGLHHLGRVSRGDTVLIHAASGGVGLAAVQLARRAGAEVFGTAGSPQKRDFLRSLGIAQVMGSRSLDFAPQVMEKTGGRGVDIVLNSLTGEFIPAGLSVLAPGGRFIELGQREVWEQERVARVRPDVTYAAFNLHEVSEREPARIGSMLRAVMEAFGEASLQPLPRREFPLEEAAAAFRYMAQARHIGKIVLTRRDGARAGTESMRLRGDATYLITGGLGGLGLEVARWMVERGARHLLLVGRRGATGRAAEVVAALEQAGARVMVAQADVSQTDQLAAALRGMGSSQPPLRGVVHAAGVLDDGVLLQQSWEKFARVMAPKVWGAWNLHRLVEGEALDFFVLFSSVSSLLGSPGQANHAAANAFLDALAHHRRTLGLPATSINWGVWSDVGSAAERNVTARVGLQGMGSFSAAEGIRLFEHLLAAGPAQVAIMPVNWARFRQALRIESPFLAELDAATRAAASRPAGSGPPDLERQLQDAPANQRRKILLAHVKAQALKVLGLDAAEDIDVRQPLNELGLDSLMAVELRNLLGAGLGGAKTLPATLVFDHPSVAELTDYLAQEVLDLGPSGQARPESEASLLDRIEQLSDDEVDRLLSARTARTEP